MKHTRVLSRGLAPVAPARSLLVTRAMLEVLNQALDTLERILNLLKGAGPSED